MSEFLTTRQVADIFGVDVGKVSDWLADGSLVGVNIARNQGGIRPRWRISREALDRFVAARSTAPQAPTPRRKKSTAGEATYY